MNEKQEKLVQLRDSRLKKERLLDEKGSVERKTSEMHPDDYKLKLRSIEIDILKTRGDIYKLEEALGLDKNDPEVKRIEEEAFKEIDELEKEFESVIPSLEPKEALFLNEINGLATDLNRLFEKLSQKGYSINNFESLKHSDNPQELLFYNEIELFIEDLDFEERLKKISENEILSFDILIPKLQDSDSRNYFFETFFDSRIPQNKLVDSFIKNISKDKNLESFKSLENSIDVRLMNEKRDAVFNLPIEESLDIILKDISSFPTDQIESILSRKCVKLFEEYLISNNLDAIKKLLSKIVLLKEKNPDKIYLSSFLPLISPGVCFNDTDMIAMFSGQMPQYIFENCYKTIISGPFLNLVPEKFLKQKSFNDEIFSSDSLSVDEITESLNKNNLVFSDLMPKSKIYILKNGKEVTSLFSKEDFSQILNEEYLNISFIPKEYHSELRDLIIKNLFKHESYLNSRNIENYINELNFNLSDLTDEQAIKIINASGLHVISLFDPSELKQFILNKDIKDLNNFYIIEILNITGLKMKDFSTDKKILILNKSNYRENIYELFEPSDLKSLVLRDDYNIKRSANIEKIFFITGLNVNDFSLDKKFDIYTSITRFAGRIENLFTIEDMRELISNYRGSAVSCLKELSPKYIESLSDEIVENLIKNWDISYVNDKDRREWFFEKLKEKIKKDENPEILKTKELNCQKVQRIQESFWFIDSQEKLPPQIIEKFNNFKNKYGKKGEGLMSLSIIAYGLENIEQILFELEKIENFSDLYNKERIPEGNKVTNGIEYEVGDFMGKLHDEENILSYSVESELIGRSANIKRGGGGDGAVYEHATKPTDNPYILMVEIELLQKIGLIDFNFKKYENASRGYHLNLGGETGLSLSEDMYFLNSVMNMTGLNGLKLGKEVSSVKGLYQKTLEDVFEKTQGGDRVEMKGMGCDSIEQFNKAILTSHYAGIAVQIVEKYLQNMTFKSEEELPDNINDFDAYLVKNNFLKNVFDSIQEKEIAFSWLKFKKEILLAVRQHNNSFVDSEFKGFLVNEKGEYVDTGDNIDIITNNKFLKDANIDLSSESFKKIYSIPEKCLIGDNTKMVNSLTRVNNLFVFKEPVLSDNKFYVDEKTRKIHLLPVYLSNAYSALTNMKGEGYVNDIAGSPYDSIIDLNGKMRNGYYYIQGASEEMITHKSQILLNQFNKKMEELLCNSTEKELENNKKQYERTI